MKKFLESWKIWTILSALSFFATFGLVVYAANSTGGLFDKYKTWATWIWNELKASDWDNLMSDLNKLEIPQWAIMAFKTDCPAGWTRFEEADGKFLRWNVNFNTNYGNWRWAETHTLTLNEMPNHSHYIVRNYSAGTSEEWLTDNNNYSDQTIVSAMLRNKDSDYSMKVVEDSANAWKSSSVWSSQSFSIMNPYIYVIFCVKN